MKRICFQLAALCLLCIGLILPASAEELLEAEAPAEFETVFCEGDLYQTGAISVAPAEVALFEDNALSQHIYKGLSRRDAEINISSFNIPYDASGKVPFYFQVINAHPELFYVGNSVEYYYNPTNNIITSLLPTYLDYTDADTQQFQSRVDSFLAEVKPGMSTVDKILAIHDKLVQEIAYNKQVASSPAGDPPKYVYSAYGALVEGDAVCQGYALAFKLLMDKINVPCQAVPSDKMNHMWNMVQLNNVWYHIDVTWDDPYPNADGRCGHDNFLRSDAEMRTLGHTTWNAGVPTCGSTSYSDSMYVFNENEHPFRWKDGKFYYLTDRALMAGVSDGAGETITTLDLSWFSGIGWYNDDLYYFSAPTTAQLGALADTQDERHGLYRYDLDDGRTSHLADFGFTRQVQVSTESGGISSSDALGMRIDETGTVRAVSSIQERSYLTHIIAADGGYTDVTPFPTEWNTGSGLHTAGIMRGNSGTIYIGIVGDSTSREVQLYVAFYNGTQLKDIQVLTPTLQPGQQWVALSPDMTQGFEQIKVFTFDDQVAPWKPLCPAVAA